MDSAGARDEEQLLDLAVKHGLLTAECRRTLMQEAPDAPCDRAIRQELLSPADVESLRPLSQPTNFLDGFEFLELIGEGATGTVYRATQIRLNRDVAIKLLKPTALQNHTATARSRIEAQLGARMQHPNIAAVYDYGIETGRVYLAMEYIEGESLLEHIESNGAMSPEDTLTIAIQVAEALEYAAARDVIHRDIKPANLVLTRADGPGNNASPKVKVLDFGLAFDEHNTDATRLTADGATLGTPCYVAPEQLGDSTVDVRADIYALGATMFHMLTGQQPFANSNALLVLAAKMNGDERWRDTLAESTTQEMARLVMDMTHHDPSQRISNYEQLRQRMDDLQNSRDGAAVNQPTTAASPDNSDWRLPVVLVLTAVLVVGTAWRFFAKDLPTGPTDVDVIKREYLFLGTGTPRGVGRGAWKPGTDAEDGLVLAGAHGWLKFEDSTEESVDGWFQFHAGVNTLGTAFADICFDIQPNGACRIVRLVDHTATLGSGMLTDDTFVVEENTKPISLLSRQDGPVYHTVSIDRQHRFVFPAVDGMPLGVLATQADNTEFAIRAWDGTVHFEGIRFVDTSPQVTESQTE